MEAGRRDVERNLAILEYRGENFNYLGVGDAKVRHRRLNWKNCQWSNSVFVSYSEERIYVECQTAERLAALPFSRVHKTVVLWRMLTIKSNCSA